MKKEKPVPPTLCTRRNFLKYAGVAAITAQALGGSEANALEKEITEALFDGRDAEQWDTARDTARLNAEFSNSTVTQTGNPSALDWSFTPRAGTTFNDLWWRKPFLSNFISIRVKLRNAGAPFTFSAKVTDADGAEWTTNQIALTAHSEWQWLNFPFPSWHVASWSNDPDGKLDSPIRDFVLIAFDLQADKSYDLQVERVEVVRPAPPVAEITEFSLPRTLRHGETTMASMSFRLSGPCHSEDSFLAFQKDGSTVFQAPIAWNSPVTRLPAGITLSARNIRVAVPEFIQGGSYAVRLIIGDAVPHWNAHRENGKTSEVEIIARNPGKSVAIVRRHFGVPTLFINSKPVDAITYMAYGPSVKVFRDFAKAGIALYSFPSTPTESGYGLAKTTWVAPGKYDYSQLDERVMMVLDADPNAHFFPRLYLHAPIWWTKEHLNDVVLLDDGYGKHIPFITPGDKPAPSWASEAWREATIEGLRRLIAHVESSPYADRCIGYHLTSGTTEEWMMWGANENEWVDYSTVNVAKFRSWLKEKYRSVNVLRKAWSNPDVTFETAEIPSKVQRMETYFGSLRNPAKEQAVIDFYLYNSDLVADTINTFAKAVKGFVKREKIVGVFYGYILQLCGEQRQQNAGHLELKKVAGSPYLDFICSPTSYAFRELGGKGTSHFMSLLGTVQMHGKMWFDENDIHTSISGGAIGEWGRPSDVQGDIIQQTKELANVIVNGTGQWWFDVGANRYDNPTLMRCISDLNRDANYALKLNRSPMDEVAMVISENSLCSLRVGDPLGTWLLLQQLPALLRIGAPVGEYLMSDLNTIRDRKLFLIMTSFAPSDEEREWVDKLKAGGRTMVFFYAPGIYGHDRIDAQGMYNLTGIHIDISANPATLQATLSGDHQLVKGLEGTTIGVNSQTFPICYANDSDAEVLATFADGKPAMAVKTVGKSVSIFSSVPMLPTSLLRRFGEKAGVHFYIDTPDQVWATRDMLGICVNDAGARKISLPRAATVRDLYRGGILARNERVFEADFEPLETRLFALEG